jgi:tight adherence protein B
VLAISSILVFLTVFLAAGLAVLIGWFALQRVGAQAEAENISEHLLDETPRLLKNETLSTISPWAKLLERSDLVKIIHRHLIQSGLGWSVGRITLSMLLMGSLAAAIAMQFDAMPGWGVMLIAAVVAALPYFYILSQRDKRFRQFEEGFPDALDSLARAMRAGHPFAAAMEIISDECEPPVSTEMRQTAVEGNLGMSWDVALSNLGERMPLLEVSMFASAIQVQNRTGGKLHEVLAKMAEDMRDATALKGEVRSLAAHGKLTGAVLTILPLVIAGIMMVVNPSYMAVLIYHPYGKYLIVSAIICLVLAHFVIRRIVDIKL